MSPATDLDPGELLLAVEERARRAPTDLAEIATPEIRAARDALKVAVGDVDRLLALIPAGEAAVPAAVLTSVIARDIHARMPARFARATLEALRQQLKKHVHALTGELGDRADPAFAARTKAAANVLVAAINEDEDPAHRTRREAEEAARAALIAVHQVRTGVRPHVARSTREIVFATELTPCPHCAAQELGDIRVVGRDTSWSAQAVCARCGEGTQVAYLTAGDPRAAHVPPDELGDGPTLQITREQLEAEYARVRARPDAAARARICLAELAKLTEPGPARDALLAARDALAPL